MLPSTDMLFTQMSTTYSSSHKANMDCERDTPIEIPHHTYSYGYTQAGHNNLTDVEIIANAWIHAYTRHTGLAQIILICLHLVAVQYIVLFCSHCMPAGVQGLTDKLSKIST